MTVYLLASNLRSGSWHQISPELISIGAHSFSSHSLDEPIPFHDLRHEDRG